jgi:tetratricopeptide (TPR) repeat protein/DNA-binding SARP family transcriptional activator
MEFRVLGTIEVRGHGGVLVARRPQQNAVLAALVVDAGRLVPTDVLVDRVWGTEPPSQARAALHAHIARIRRQLDEAGAAGGAPARLAHRSGGYTLEVALDRVDLHRFRHLVEQARPADCPDEKRVSLLREALDLWQGEPLAGVPGDWAARTREAWRQQFVGAAVAWAQAELRVGGPEAVIGPLADLLGEFPLVEPLAVALIRALYAAGRAAEALEWYARIRDHVGAAIGVEPGDELLQLHQMILRGDPDPARPTVHPRMAPALLPVDVYGFAGRNTELARLDAILAGAADQPTAVIISAVSGTAGVGKTALAVRWAHRVRQEFPDGQLYTNLRGFDPSRRATPPEEALRGFLHALGVSARQLPPSLDAQIGLYRSLLVGKRMLVVLDNARDAEQVRPLLPGTPGCLVVVTSRHQLTGLVAHDGAQSLTLDLLDPDGARDLLARRIGTARITAEPAAAEEIIGRCARLPLALTVAAAQAATRPGLSLAALAQELREADVPLDALAGYDPATDVRAVLSWSYRQLSAPAAGLFRMLGLASGADLPIAAAAALCGTTTGQVRPLLAELLRANLIAEAVPGRYTFHDLLRAYAAEEAGRADDARERRTAVGRLFDHYLAAATTAVEVLFPGGMRYQPVLRPPDPAPMPLRDPDAARAWLDAERRTLVAVAAHTATHGWPRHAIDLSAVLFRYLDSGHYADAVAIHKHALAAARQLGDPAGQAQALTLLGGVYLRLGRYPAAAERLNDALAIGETADDRAHVAHALVGLGNVDWRLGRYARAAELFQRALALFQDVHDLPGEAGALGCLGIVCTFLSRHAEATGYHERSLVLDRQLGNRDGQARGLNNLGLLYVRTGRYEVAADHFRQALAIARQLGNRYGEGETLTNLGEVQSRLGSHTEAIENHRRAVALFRETGERYGEACALNGLGEALHAFGDHTQAVAQHADALAVAVEIGDREQTARAHTGTGHAHRAAGDPDRARTCWERALALYIDLDVPEADAVRQHLVALRAESRDGAPPPR